jgi:GNAT superfamily N-acetyltransferase
VRPAWCSERIGERHDLAGFGCGVPELDAWLKTTALRADRQDTGRTYVWTKDDGAAVAAYYTIAPTTVHRAGISRAAAGGNSQLPSYLLARLALDRSLHGRGLGGALLIDALRRVDRAVAATGGRLLVVDPTDSRAREFYLHFGFVQVVGQERLYLRASTIRALLAAPGPQDPDPRPGH